MFLKIKNLNKTFSNGLECLTNISLELKNDDFLSIVGPSGCGKSTLLKIISDLVSISKGKIIFSKDNPNISFVFQEPSLLPWANVFDNVMLPLRLKYNALNREKVDFFINLVGLYEFSKSYPRELSGGMKMRVSIARALVTDPELILFDEPFSALDEFTREQLNYEILALKDEINYNSIFVTHNIREAVFLSNRILLFSNRPGTIIKEMDILFPYPRNEILKTEKEFNHICNDISSSLKETKVN